MEAEDVEEIERLRATVVDTSSLDDSQVLRPKCAQTDEEFQDFLRSKRCQVCLQVPRYPVAIVEENCGHEGCESCLSKLEVCPIGRCGTYGPAKLLPFKNWPLRARVSFNQDLQVRCAKCTAFEGGTTVERLVKHELRECPSRTVTCPGKLCEVQGTPADIMKHYPTCSMDLNNGNVTMQHVSRWEKERKAQQQQRARELEAIIVSEMVQAGEFGVAAAYRRGDMSVMNHVMRNTVFDL